MSFASTAKRRLPWLDTTRLAQAEKAAKGYLYEDAIADLVITLFEELSAQSAARKAPELEDGTCKKCGSSRRWCECTPLLGTGET